MIQLVLQLFLAHILGDFVFQKDEWIRDKERQKHKSPFLYVHILIHAVLLVGTLQLDFEYWAGMLIIIVSHYILELLDAHLQKIINSRGRFLISQLAHLVVIAFVVNMYEPFTLDLGKLYSPLFLLTIIALVLVTFVSSMVMKMIITQWNLEEDSDKDSLNNAGKYIGILERLVVFGFVAMNHWQAIGFLLAAKSVFRFGDLSKAKDRKLTEYILIGTLTSFGLAIAIGMGYVYFSGILKGK